MDHSQGAEENSGRVWQLIIGIVCMVMIANLQYGWSFFVDPMSKTQGWSRAAIGGAFSFFVLAETWLVPVEGWFVDKFGPRIVVTLGGILVALAWLLNSMASSIPMLYAGAIVGGIGAGAVYGTWPAVIAGKQLSTPCRAVETSARDDQLAPPVVEDEK